MPLLGKAKRHQLKVRNKKIYDMYNNYDNPMSMADIADVLKMEGIRLTRQQISNIIRELDEEDRDRAHEEAGFTD